MVNYKKPKLKIWFKMMLLIPQYKHKTVALCDYTLNEFVTLQTCLVWQGVRDFSKITHYHWSNLYIYKLGAQYNLQHIKIHSLVTHSQDNTFNVTLCMYILHCHANYTFWNFIHKGTPHRLLRKKKKCLLKCAIHLRKGWTSQDIWNRYHIQSDY